MKIRLLRLFLTLWSFTCFPISGWSNTYYPPKSIHPFLNYALLTDPGGISTDLSLWLKGATGLGRYTLMPKLATWPNYDVQLIAGTLTIRHDPSRVQVSGVLTPNSGTAEAVWTITNIDQYPNNHVRVYNKNQQLVWSQQGYKNTWRGIDANSYRPLPAAPYYYVVDLKNGKPPIQGWFYLTY